MSATTWVYERGEKCCDRWWQQYNTQCYFCIDGRDSAPLVMVNILTIPTGGADVRIVAWSCFTIIDCITSLALNHGYSCAVLLPMFHLYVSSCRCQKNQASAEIAIVKKWQTSFSRASDHSTHGTDRCPVRGKGWSDDVGELVKFCAINLWCYQLKCVCDGWWAFE